MTFCDVLNSVYISYLTSESSYELSINVVQLNFFRSVSTKLFVGKLPDTLSVSLLKSEFEAFGKVMECDIVKDYAFVVSYSIHSIVQLSMSQELKKYNCQ